MINGFKNVGHVKSKEHYLLVLFFFQLRNKMKSYILFFKNLFLRHQIHNGPVASSGISSICVPFLHQHPIELFGFRLGYGLPSVPHLVAAAGTSVPSKANKTKVSIFKLIFYIQSYHYNHQH